VYKKLLKIICFLIKHLFQASEENLPEAQVVCANAQERYSIQDVAVQGRERTRLERERQWAKYRDIVVA